MARLMAGLSPGLTRKAVAVGFLPCELIQVRLETWLQTIKIRNMKAILQKVVSSSKQAPDRTIGFSKVKEWRV